MNFMTVVYSFNEKLQEFINFFTTTSITTIAAALSSSVAVIIFIIYFFWKPTNKFIVKQKERLDRAHEDLASATKETKIALGNLKSTQKHIASEQHKILAERLAKEKEILAQKMQEAEQAKSSIIREASKKAKEIESEAKKTVNDKIISLSVELAEKLIKGSINKQVQTQIIDNYLDEIDNAFQKDLHGKINEISR